MSRTASVQRTTRETDISLDIDLDSAFSENSLATGVPLFDHFLSAFQQHSQYGIRLKARGDLAVDPHHLIEDVGICLGDAVRQALGNRGGIHRYGQRYLPMDEALVLAVVDISGRGQLFWSGAFPERPVNNLSSELWPEFFKGFAQHAEVTLHLICHAGLNAHHVYEAAFKGFGRALAEATMVVDPELRVPSTKGML